LYPEFFLFTQDQLANGVGRDSAQGRLVLRGTFIFFRGKDRFCLWIVCWAASYSFLMRRILQILRIRKIKKNQIRA
jgi:hypothetical protein